MTTRNEIRKHRQRGRGRKAFWILAAVGLAAVIVAAGRGSGREHRPAAGRFGAHQELTAERIQELFGEDSRWPERLGIDDEQRRRIAAMLGTSAPRLQALSAEGDAVRRELAEVFAAPTPDAERIEELRWKAAEIVVRGLDEGFDAAVELAEVLTPEQRSELVRHWEEQR